MVLLIEKYTNCNWCHFTGTPIPGPSSLVSLDLSLSKKDHRSLRLRRGRNAPGPEAATARRFPAER